MSRIRLPEPRGVRATLDGPDDATACVVACPPHPRYGGSRTDSRLRAVADALAESGVATLRFDYGARDEGRGERRDAAAALDWVRERYERVGLFDYSFGGAVALVVAADREGVDALAALAPASRLEDESDASEAVAAVETLPTDHHFVGHRAAVGECAAEFLTARL